MRVVFLVLAFLITEFSLMALIVRKSYLPPIRNTFTDLSLSEERENPGEEELVVVGEKELCRHSQGS